MPGPRTFVRFSNVAQVARIVRPAGVEVQGGTGWEEASGPSLVLSRLGRPVPPRGAYLRSRICRSGSTWTRASSMRSTAPTSTSGRGRPWGSLAGWAAASLLRRAPSCVSCPPPAALSQGRSSTIGRRATWSTWPPGSSRGHDPRDQGSGDRYGLPGANVVVEPRPLYWAADRRSDRTPSQPHRVRGAGPGDRIAGPGGDARAAAHHRPVSPRVEWRHVPTCDDRDGALQLPQPLDCRRAHHGPGCDNWSPDLAAHAYTPASLWYGHHVHYSQFGCHCSDGR